MHQDAILPVGASGARGGSGWVALLALCAAQFVVVLSFQGAAITIPLMQQTFAVSPATGQWLISANALAFGGLLLLAGRAGDLLGHRRLFTGGLAIFAAASGFAALAPAVVWLIVARIAQGIGLAMFVPSCLALLVATFPDDAARRRAMAAWGMAGPLGGIAALLSSGFLIEAFSWRSLYVLMAGAALLPVVAARAVFPADPPRGSAALNPGNAILGAGGIGALLFGLGEASQTGLAARATLSILLGGALLGIFLVRERRGTSPLVPVALWRERALLAAAGAAFLNGAATNTPIVFYVLYLQQQGVAAWQSSLGFIPCNLAIIAASVFVPRVVARRGMAGAMAYGMAVTVVGLLALATLPLGGSYLRTFLPGLLLVGFGLGWAQVGIVGTAAESVAAAAQGIAAGLVNTSAQLGTAVGLAALVAVSTVAGGEAGGAASAGAGFAGAALFALLGLLAAFAAGRLQRATREASAPGQRSAPAWAVPERTSG